MPESDEANNTTAVLSEPVQSDELLGLRLETTDADDNRLSTVNVGDVFYVRAMASDLRENPQGVFAAFADLVYDSHLATVAGSITYGDSFPNVHEGDATEPGLVDEVGAVADVEPMGAGEFLLFSIPFTATGIGTVQFETNAADVLPQHDSLLVGEPSTITRIAFGQQAVAIVQGTVGTTTDEDHNVDVSVAPNTGFTIPAFDAISSRGAAITDNGDGTLRYDPRSVQVFQALRSTSQPIEDTFAYTLRDSLGGTSVGTATITVTGINDHDGFVTPLDALIVINELNRNRPRALPISPEPQNFAAPFVDVNNDIYVTPLDVLLIVNRLNALNSEGEAVPRDAIFSAFRSSDSSHRDQVVVSASIEFDELSEDLLDMIVRDIATKLE
ncbi:MAG: dockerin type I domain-containing protein [Planctomycetota bacterium]